MPHVTQFLLMRSYRVKIQLLYFSKTSHLLGINRSYRDLCKWIRRVQGQRGGGECCWKSWWSAGFFNWPAQFQNGRFDLPVLVHAERCLLETLNSSWRSCIDSLAVCHKVFPGQPNYKQGHLVNSLLYATYKAHDAMEDVISLSLCTKTMLSDNDLLADSFASDAVYNNLLFSQAKS